MSIRAANYSFEKGRAGWTICSVSSIAVAVFIAVSPPVVFSHEYGRAKKLEALGRTLFEDKRLSRTGDMSCANCHQPARAFTDGRARSIGVSDQIGTRNAPSLANITHVTHFFWDGRGASLSAVLLEPFTNPVEHGLRDVNELLRLLRSDAEYVRRFQGALGLSGRDITPQHVGESLAAFVTVIAIGETAFDRFAYKKQDSALNASQIRGFELFRGRAQCASCHTIGPTSAPFTDGGFHRLGIGSSRIERKLPALTRAARIIDSRKLGHIVLSDPDMAELGRYIVTGKPADIGKFRTPSLRNVALTAPYMHDGSIATLEEAVDFELYYRVQADGRQILLSAEEKTDLVEFLKSLTSDAFLKN